MEVNCEFEGIFQHKCRVKAAAIFEESKPSMAGIDGGATTKTSKNKF
jgi:hypothetical protein